MEAANINLVFCLGLALTISGQGESNSSDRPFGKSNQEIRKEAFRFLFEEFIIDKQCLWHKANTHLREVIVYKRSETNEGQSGNSTNSVKLGQGSNKVVGFFDQIVVQSDQLESLQFAVISLDSKNFHAPLVKKAGNIHLFQVPPLPLPVGQETKELKLVVDSDQLIDQISFRTKVPLTSHFEEYAKLKSVFNAKKGNFHDEAQVSLLKKIDEVSFEVLASSLRDQTEEFARIIVPAQLTATTDIISINGVLSDRRVAKLYELLSRMDREDAASLAASSFENELTRFMDDWETTDILPARKRYAAEAQLFLCSEFCTPKTFIKNIERWEDWHRSSRDKKSFQFRKQARPDFLLMANLYANVIMKQRNMTLDETNAWLGRTLSPVLAEGSPSPFLKQSWLRSSDWTPSRIDLIADVPTFQSFKSLYNVKVQERVLSRLRSEID